MPEEPEVETKELQDTIEELQADRKERAEEAKAMAWTRSIGLTTALLAVFAAIGALQAGSLVNEAMILQLKASDKWNEYQADRQKDHLYSVEAQTLLDHGAKLPAARSTSMTQTIPLGSAPLNGAKAVANAAQPQPKSTSQQRGGLTPSQRLTMYIHQVDDEQTKEKDLKDEAQKLEQESATNMRLHEKFAQAVTLIQVAVALAAIAALSKLKWVWFFSLLIGFSGIIIFILACTAKIGLG